MKKMLIISTLFLLTACNLKDEQFCKCLKAGEELNDFSSKLFQEEMTEDKAKKLIELKEVKRTQCADYQTMKGEEMLQKKEACK